MDTDISVIIDGSGSMFGSTEDTISGFNSWLKETVKGVKQGDDVRISVTVFNTIVRTQVEAVPLQACPKLGSHRNEYKPMGGTALLDAVGMTLEAAKERVKKKQRGLALIITDGYENSSRVWDTPKLGRLMTKLERSGRWSFVYMGADFDAFAQAQTYNPRAVASSSVLYNKRFTNEAWTANAGATTSYMASSAPSSTTLGAETQVIMEDLTKDKKEDDKEKDA